MDGDGPQGNGKHESDSHKSFHNVWSTMAQQHLFKEQSRSRADKRILEAYAERDVAIRHRDIAVLERRIALHERDAAREERDRAIDERNSALIERDNAILAFQYNRHYNSTQSDIMKAFPISIIMSEDPEPSATIPTKQEKNVSSSGSDSDPPRDGSSIGVKTEFEWVDQNLINFDESTMPPPVCSCTGVRRRCLKAGNGGWQSSCCTTTMSSYPLPYNRKSKRRSRIIGRKMSGTTFSRLLTQLAEGGHVLSTPVDLKDHWARQGSNGRHNYLK